MYAWGYLAYRFGDSSINSVEGVDGKLLPDGRIDRRTDGQTDRQTDGRTANGYTLPPFFFLLFLTDQYQLNLQ